MTITATDNFQAQSKQQGNDFEQLVAFHLKANGWTIRDTCAKRHGCEIDIIADDPNGIEHWIECKGSHRGKIPGLLRADTVKKAVGVAWYLSTFPDNPPYLLIGSHGPRPDTVSQRLIDMALGEGLFADVMVMPTTFDTWGAE